MVQATSEYLLCTQPQRAAGCFFYMLSTLPLSAASDSDFQTQKFELEVFYGSNQFEEDLSVGL